MSWLVQLSSTSIRFMAGNIFICHPDQEDASAHPVYDSDCCSREAVNQIIYKIGNFVEIVLLY